MHKASFFSKATQSTGAAAAPAPAKAKAQDEREARIAKLREQYLAGTYEVDALEVSRKLIDSHLAK
jgi:anti-sigma28 factor (negative regulator of flagellin synthesis)